MKGSASGVKTAQDGIEMEEIWTSPSGGALAGVHKDVKGGKTVGFEFFRIAAGPDGLVYHASPNARARHAISIAQLADKTGGLFQ